MPEWITKYWVEWLFGIVAAVLLGMYKKMASRVKKTKEESDAIRNGLRSLLRRQLIEDCEDCIREGFCPITRRDTIKDMYKSYHTLGGNGSVTDLYDKVMDLPTVDPNS